MKWKEKDIEELEKEIVDLGVWAWKMAEKISKKLSINLSEAGIIEMWKKIYDTLMETVEVTALDEFLELIGRR